jgi:hypothetical protein
MSVIRKRSLLAKQYEQNAKDSFGKLRERMSPSGASSFSIGRASGWKRPPSFSSDLYLLSIELIEAAENGLPRSFMIPRAASWSWLSVSSGARPADLHLYNNHSSLGAVIAVLGPYRPVGQ